MDYSQNFLYFVFRGQSPEEADLYFLENAKKLAFYGMDMHKVKNKEGETQMIGIYYDGIVVFRDRLRINRFHWPRILKILYRGKNFILLLRPHEVSNDRSLTYRYYRNRNPVTSDSVSPNLVALLILEPRLRCGSVS